MFVNKGSVYRALTLVQWFARGSVCNRPSFDSTLTRASLNAPMSCDYQATPSKVRRGKTDIFRHCCGAESESKWSSKQNTHTNVGSFNTPSLRHAIIHNRRFCLRSVLSMYSSLRYTCQLSALHTNRKRRRQSATASGVLKGHCASPFEKGVMKKIWRRIPTWWSPVLVQLSTPGEYDYKN